MMSAKSYIEHAKQQRIFVESYRYSPYWWGNSDCDEIVKNMDLSNEDSIRKVIREVSKLANKPIDKVQENKIVREILKNGINDNLFNMI